MCPLRLDGSGAEAVQLCVSAFQSRTTTQGQMRLARKPSEFGWCDSEKECEMRAGDEPHIYLLNEQQTDAARREQACIRINICQIRCNNPAMVPQ